MSDRNVLLESVRVSLESDDRVLALWEMGSTSFGRADQLSDLDLCAVVAAGAVAETQERLEQSLERVAPIDLRFVLPQPLPHGHWQAFYRLAGISPYLQIDVVLMEEGSANWFLEPEIHGRAAVLFDKRGLIHQEPTDAAAFAQRLAKRLPALEVPAELFHIFVEKELTRERPVDALSYYQGMIVPRLVEALRMRYSPWRYNFGLRYLQYDLPAERYAQLRSLVYVAGPDQLVAQKEQAMALLRETLAELKAIDLQDLLERSR